MLGCRVALLGSEDVGAGARGREPRGRERVGRVPWAPLAVDAKGDPTPTSRKCGLKSLMRYASGVGPALEAGVPKGRAGCENTLWKYLQARRNSFSLLLLSLLFMLRRRVECVIMHS